MQENLDEINSLKQKNEDQDRRINELQSRIQVQNSELTITRMRNQGQSNQIQSMQQEHQRMMDRLQKLENKINIFEFTNEFTFKVENFSQELQNAVADRAIVKYFYTVKRHRMKISLYLKGSSEENRDYMGLFFGSIFGSFDDDDIEWPIKAVMETEFLINGRWVSRRNLDTTTCPGNAFQKPDGNNQQRGYPKFLSIERVNRIAEISDNTLSIKLKVNYK